MTITALLDFINAESCKLFTWFIDVLDKGRRDGFEQFLVQRCRKGFGERSGQERSGFRFDRRVLAVEGLDDILEHRFEGRLNRRN